MKNVLTLAAIVALGLTACSPGGDSGTAGGGLSESQCRDMVGKSRDLAGMPDDVFVEAGEQAVQQCAASTNTSQADYDCAMAASTADEFRACGIDVIG